MGDLNVKLVTNQKQLNDFTKQLLLDVQALKRMIEEDWFDDSPARIGAEQEICLIDQHYKPAPVAMDLLERLGDETFTTELAKFNIEANLPPLDFKDKCFSTLENNIVTLLSKLRKTANDMDIDFLITGILPTLRKFDMHIDNLTPLQRYHALIKAISKLRGKVYELRIKGIDELHLKHDSAMLEACNTSFQVHLQVRPEEFVQKYNIAQLLTAPTIAIASNSPLLFGKRLWSETRVALFQQTIDTRVASEHLRVRSPRVTFGNQWLQNSILDLYKEDIVRFRIMLMTQREGDVMKLLNDGITPKLRALTIHNSTVYRWNRPCYGISSNGKPHFRIENRVLPAGPSVIDEVANAAFWLGLMNAFGNHYANVDQLMDFDEAKSNFMATSFNGINSEITWLNGKKLGVSKLIKDELLPIAREGLANNHVNKDDIDKYMSVIEERNEARQNGTVWLLNSFSKLSKERRTREEVMIAITSAMAENQKKGVPVHQWEDANVNDINNWHPSKILVEEFMTTDIFTVHKDDIPEFVADIMDWQKIRYTPVEDEKGKLTGLITSRTLLRYFCEKHKLGEKPEKTVNDLMIKDPMSISPNATIIEAMNLMRKTGIGCLPVVNNDKLVGVVTEGNFINITGSLLNILKEKRIS